MARARRAAEARRRTPEARRRAPTAAWAVLLAFAASADALRIGFFADDFHFIDVARRVPLWRALGGAYGLYPWYRPLSREVFFAAVAPFGAAAPLVAHLANLLAVAVTAWLLYELARRIAGERVAAVAPALFVACEWTRFLSAWASGFQDLLAAALLLLALLDHVRARHVRAALWVMLAPLAKETGFLALPLMLLYAVLIEKERRPRRWMIPAALAAVLPAALHVVARLSWRGGGSSAVVRDSLADLPRALLQVLGGFIQLQTPPLAGSIELELTAALAAAAAFGAAALLRTARGPGPAERPSAPGAIAFAGVGVVLGLAPLVMGAALHLTLANPYYAFPAVPFLCLLAALLLSRAPRPVLRAAAWLVPALVAWNVIALRYQPPSPLEDSAWTFHRWDWREAERLNVVSARLIADVRRSLAADVRRSRAARPESLVVLYGGLPTGSFFQSEDGPATRVALGDPTARAWYINGVPAFVEPGRFAVLMFDPAEKRLVRGGMAPLERVRAAATAIFRGQAETAWAYASWLDAGEPESADRAYARAAARLLAGGAADFRAALSAGGLADSAGGRPAELAAAEFPSDDALRKVYEFALRGPLQSARHAALAEALLARNYTIAGGFELRLAVTLDPTRAAEAVQLAQLLEADRTADRPASSGN